MPIPAIVAAGVAQSGGNILSQGINAIAQGIQNKKSRQWSEYMYDKQRADSLADWNMVNAYNHPSAQMDRFIAAGLNPNFIYGGSPTMSDASPVRSSNVQGAQFNAPQFDFGSALGDYFNVQFKIAQTDAVLAQTDVAHQEAELKEAQRLATLASIDQTRVNTDRTRFDLDLDSELRDVTIEARQQALNKLKADVDNTIANTLSTLDENERRKVMQAKTIDKMAEEILTIQLGRAKTRAEIREIQKRISLLSSEDELKKWEVELSRYGIRPSDPFFIRVPVNAANRDARNTSEIPSSAGGAFKAIKSAVKSVKKRR